MRPAAHTSPPETPGQCPSSVAAPALPAAVKSEALFEGACELLIDHRGVMYRLRQTSLGKLIQTKQQAAWWSLCDGESCEHASCEHPGTPGAGDA